jgi:hypothetical protein
MGDGTPGPLEFSCDSSSEEENIGDLLQSHGAKQPPDHPLLLQGSKMLVIISGKHRLFLILNYVVDLATVGMLYSALTILRREVRHLASLILLGTTILLPPERIK